MPKKPGLTLEQHENLGIELQTMHDKLSKIASELFEAYPAKISSHAQKAIMNIQYLKGELASKMIEENKGIKDSSKLYYRSWQS